jgi:hypothetical protein
MQMNQINKTGDFTNEIERELNEIRTAASDAQQGLRTLREMELGWISGGDGGTVWV